METINPEGPGDILFPLKTVFTERKERKKKKEKSINKKRVEEKRKGDRRSSL